MFLTATVAALMSLVQPAAADAEVLNPATRAATGPASWSEFVNQYVGVGTLGTWVTKSTTEDMWVGIPAGLKITETGTESFSEDSKAIIGGYTMVLDDGTVVSTGTHVITWDKAVGKVVRTNSGFDMGKPYHGTSTLTAMDGASLRWKYTEQSQGKTTTYEQRLTAVGPNERHNTNRKLPDGKPWNTTMRRANPFADAMKGCDLTGTWEMAATDGGKMVGVGTLELDGRMMRFAEHHVDQAGKKTPWSHMTMWWDGATETIRMQYSGADGGAAAGEVTSLSSGPRLVTMVSRYQGSDGQGNAMSASFTRTVQGDTMTLTCSAFSSKGMPTPPWVGTPIIWKRAGSNNGSKGGPKNPKELVDRVVNALAANNFEAFKALTVLGMRKAAFKQFMKGSGAGQRKAARVWDDANDDFKSELKNDVRKAFQAMQDGTRRMGFDWSQAKVTEFEFDGDAKCKLVSGGMTALLHLDDCLMTPLGLLMFDRPRAGIIRK